MSYFNRLVVLALFGLFIVTVSMAVVPMAGAQVAPLAVGAGNLGNGITNTWYSSSGVGQAANTDRFANSIGGLGWGGYGGCGGCGFGAWPFASWGPFSADSGGNWGTQNSAVTGSAGASSFGLQPIGLTFGVPVAGAGGYLYT